jgi:membrane peptidoglycan carboxypeptidase
LEVAFGIEQGLTLDTPIPATAITLPKANGGKDWVVHPEHECQKLDCGTENSFPIKDGLSVSSNLMAARLIQLSGVNPFAQKLKGLGMDVGDGPYNASMVLGAVELSPLDLARGYGGMSLNAGKKIEPYTIDKIVDKSDTVVYQHTAPQDVQVFTPQSAEQATIALNGVITKPYGTAYNVVPPSLYSRVAGKTGTAGAADGSKENTDVWFTGSFCDPASGGKTASYWVGLPEGRTPFKGVSSHDIAEMWGDYITNAPHSDEACSLAE